ncbi:MAG: hypothetical protein HQM02_01795 [Magnetococcales bacterium]|nr:hypothetical protein [Magnetococcales bacterium]
MAPSIKVKSCFLVYCPDIFIVFRVSTGGLPVGTTCLFLAKKSKENKRFFIEDVHQLQQIRANFLYGAPIHIMFETSALERHDTNYRLPMIKLYNRDGSPGDNNARSTLREMIHRRVPPQ